ncbi:hypothetical protein Tco_0770398 [Tanacetum coccineum]|uniref:Uncharacterized protein n=1 Tax=Tanacetum coccineum TaxID=301880 RepID=A0ABQ4ZFP4_9ASTR
MSTTASNTTFLKTRLDGSYERRIRIIGDFSFKKLKLSPYLSALMLPSEEDFWVEVSVLTLETRSGGKYLLMNSKQDHPCLNSIEGFLLNPNPGCSSGKWEKA